MSNFGTFHWSGKAKPQVGGVVAAAHTRWQWDTPQGVCRLAHFVTLTFGELPPWLSHSLAPLFWVSNRCQVHCLPWISNRKQFRVWNQRTSPCFPGLVFPLSSHPGSFLFFLSQMGHLLSCPSLVLADLLHGNATLDLSTELNAGHKSSWHQMCHKWT